MAFIKGYKMSEDHKRKIGLRNSQYREIGVLRNKRDEITVECHCQICGVSRTVKRSIASEYPLCVKCAAIERDRKHINITGHGPHYRGSKYFSGRIIGQWKNNAKDRHLVWDLSFDYLDGLYDKQKGLCELSGMTLGFNYGDNNKVSLDRIDCKMGYIVGNVQLVASIVNKVKQNLSDKELVVLSQLIYANSKRKRQ
jgi:hypothetical protein